MAERIEGREVETDGVGGGGLEGRQAVFEGKRSAAPA